MNIRAYIIENVSAIMRSNNNTKGAAVSQLENRHADSSSLSGFQIAKRRLIFHAG